MADWSTDRFPIDLGDGVHRAAWDLFGDARFPDDLWWLHRCKHALVPARIDVTSGTMHTLVSRDPLHIEPSILCRSCNDHGFIRDGKWVAA